MNRVAVTPVSPPRVLFHDLLAVGACAVGGRHRFHRVLTLVRGSTSSCSPRSSVSSRWRFPPCSSWVVRGDGSTSRRSTDPSWTTTACPIAAVRPRPLDRWVQRRAPRKGYRTRRGALAHLRGPDDRVAVGARRGRIDPPPVALDRRVDHTRAGGRVLLAGVGGVGRRFARRRPVPYRIGVAAVAMWTVWVIAYLMAMAQNTWYTGFRHVSHRLLLTGGRPAGDDGVMWFLTACRSSRSSSRISIAGCSPRRIPTRSSTNSFAGPVARVLRDEPLDAVASEARGASAISPRSSSPGSVAKRRISSPSSRDDDDAHADAQRDHGVAEVDRRQGSAEREVGRGTQDVPHARPGCR